MTASPSASSRNRRSATLANIPPPSGPPPPTPPGGQPSGGGHRHSNSSSALSASFSSGPLNLSGLGPYTAGSSFAPPRASFSSSRASPVGQARSGRERSDTETWSDSTWRNIFDAALVKAQQAVQLDELQETALAANLYAQAASDLGRVIPMCSSEKKQQSMMAIQAIYLDRVAQLKESALSKSPLPHSLGTGSFAPGHVKDGSTSSGNSYRHSAPSNRGTAYGDDQLPYQPQQYQPPSFQSPVQQQRYTQSGPIQLQQQYQPPPVFLHSRQDPYQLQQLQQQQQQQHQQRLLYLQQHQQQQQQPQQQEELQQEQPEKGGFRLFGKKRSKTQPSAPRPPEMGQSAHGVLGHNSSYGNGFSPYGEYNGNSTPHDSPNPSPVVVSPIFMSQSPVQRSQQSRNSVMGDGREQQQQQPQELTSKSSKWRPFGKKKSKSFSNNETSTAFNPQRESLQVVPGESLPSPLPAKVPTSAPQLADNTFSHQNQDWYVDNVPQGELEADYDDYENQYYDEDDEDVDPYYIADTKGRAQVFEGRDSGLKDKASKKNSKKEEEAPPKTRQTLKHSTSSYSQEHYYSANVNFSEHIPSNPAIKHDAQELYSGPLADEKAYTSNFTDDNPDDAIHEHDQQLLPAHADQYSEYEEQFMDAQESFTADAQDSALPDTYEVGNEETAAQGTVATDSAFDPTVESAAEGTAVVVEDQVETSLEKTKSKRTWFGKKKKDKEKNKDKVKEPERFDDVAKLMDEALFGGGGSSRKATKQKLKEKESVISLVAAAMPEEPQQQQQQQQQQQSEDIGAQTSSQTHLEPQMEASVDDQEQTRAVVSAETHAEMQSSVESPRSVDEQVNPEPQVVDESGVEVKEVSEASEVPEVTVTAVAAVVETEEVADGSVHDESGKVSIATQESKPIASDAPKRTMTRHFSIFKSRKTKDVDQHQHQEDEGTSLTRTTTVEDEKKSIHSHLTQQSSHSAQDRKAAEMTAAVTVRSKEKQAKKRDSDEYVPYEYQEELEGPLMERVEVPEHREIIGFVMPIEEIGDYTMEENEEAALENWDSWVSQLESFEKILSDKGMKKEKTKKSKKVKEPKPSKEESASPMGSVKANRSSIFGLGRSETLKSRNSTTLDLNTHLLDSRPLSMSTTVLDDPSMGSSRLSFQSSKSGESETPTMQALAHQQQQQQQSGKKRWWNPKRKDTNSLYRVSNAFSMADLDDNQDRHLLALRQADPIRSSDSLMLDTKMKPLPSDLTEPSTPAPGVNSVQNKERPELLGTSLEKEQEADQKEDIEGKMVADVEIDVKPKTEVDAEMEISPKTQVEAEMQVKPKAEAETEAEVEAKSEKIDVPTAVTVAITPEPKAKAKSSKPKLLPISTPLQQLLKLDSAEELWQYVQQAKTYATSRMNKGDKRSASIALKRAQALEARWQEVLLEMASSGEDTDEILEEEEDDDDEEEEEGAHQDDQLPPEAAKKEPAVMELKKETIAPVPVVPMAAPPTPTPTGVAFNTPNTHSGIRFEAADEDEEEDEFEAHMKRRSTISRSNSTPDKYSKYKVNKTPTAASSTSSSTNVSSSLAILAEEETNEQGELLVKTSPVDDGRLGPEATMEQLVASTNKEHLKFYIQRMKTDTVAKARSGSKFAALEGMKNVKVLQQRLADLEEEEEEEEEQEEEEKSKIAVKGEAEVSKSVDTTHDDDLKGQGTVQAEVVSEEQP
ncbi:hypothetical protein EC968_008677 [Mortierella alpina]|nr:hypothetical protein EC968_008677 [Mortierella alpina]